MANIAEQLSSYATSLRYEELPPDVIHLPKRMIIDTLGWALVGCNGELEGKFRSLACGPLL